MTLRGKNSLVTGAARGIGRGSARARADAGANLVLAGLANGPSALGYELAGRAEPTPEGVALDVAGGVEAW